MTFRMLLYIHSLHFESFLRYEIKRSGYYINMKNDLKITRKYWQVLIVTNIKKSRLRARRPIRPAHVSGFISMRRLGVFLLPLNGMLVHRRVTPSISPGAHLYTWVGRDTVRVKCLAQEQNTVSPARTRTRTTRSGVEHSNHEATARY